MISLQLIMTNIVKFKKKYVFVYRTSFLSTFERNEMRWGLRFMDLVHKKGKKKLKTLATQDEWQMVTLLRNFSKIHYVCEVEIYYHIK